MKKKAKLLPHYFLNKFWLITRLSVIINLVAVLQVSATTASTARVSMNAKNEIERSSGSSFLLYENAVEMNKNVTVSANDCPLPEHLGKILNDIKMSSEAAQKQTVNGVITDATTGEALPGVNITVEGSTLGVVTDLDGKFSIDVPSASSVLVFSFVGYNTERVTVGNQTSLTIALVPDIKSLEEVVVVGYGTQKKVNMTGAVSAVKMDEKITSRPLTNVSSSLSGMVPGLAVNVNSGMAGKNSASMMIRGLGSVNNSNPLVVVDGMPDIDINRLNMNDIESVSVLKDATSSAVYGSRAANGVILITTKSGKGQNKNRINFSSNYGVTVPTKAYDFMADYPRSLSLHQNGQLTNTLEQNLIYKRGTVDQWMALGMIDPIRYPNTDWWKVIMRNGEVQNYNLSSSGGNDKSNFFVSIGMMDEKGLQINNDFKRYNARFNYDYKLNKNMNVGAKFDGNWSKMIFSLEDGFIDDNSGNTAGLDLQYAIAGITPYDPATGYYGGVMAYNEDAQAYNPYTVYVNNLNHRNRQEVNPSLYWDWSPLKGLTARVDYALSYYNEFNWSAATPNRSYNFQTNSYGSRVYVGDNAGVSNSTSTGYKTLLNGRLTYEKKIAQNHQLNGLFVYSEEYWNTRSQYSSRSNRLAPDLHEVDAALTIPGEVSASGSSSAEGLRSYIGRLNYTAYDKYLLEANFRYDGSSKFLMGRHYGFFPSAALGWRFSEENFIRNFTQNWLNAGKFRFSYGALGNNWGVGRYEQREYLNASHYMTDGNIAKGLVYQKMVNEDLSWEATQVMNIGLDLGFFDNRLSAEIDYYNRLTTGMLRPSEMSILLTGRYDAPRQNIGELRNRGIEGNFTWREKRGEVNYMFNLNASYNQTTLEKWNEFLAKGWTFLNMPYHYLYTYEDIGIAQTWQDVYNATPQGASPGDILRKDLNGDGRISGEDKRAYPNIQRDRPTTNFALNGQVSWKGFDFSFLLSGAAGRKDYWINIFNNTSIGTRYAATWNHWNNPWSWDNRDGIWPRLNGNANREETTFWLDNLAYLRVKNIQLGYSLPSNLLQRIHVESFRVYGSIENLYTLTKFRGLDPEGQGHKSDTYPINKVFSFGVNIGI